MAKATEEVTKVSKFEKNLIAKMDEANDEKKVASLAFRKASSIVEQQIAALEFSRVNLEIKVEEKGVLLENATYNKDFSLTNYDNAKAALDTVEEELADVESTLEARRELLESWK